MYQESRLADIANAALAAGVAGDAELAKVLAEHVGHCRQKPTELDYGCVLMLRDGRQVTLASTGGRMIVRGWTRPTGAKTRGGKPARAPLSREQAVAKGRLMARQLLEIHRTLANLTGRTAAPKPDPEWTPVLNRETGETEFFDSDD